MGNDIVRGIVELITNSDAAYSASRISKRSQRPITVLVNSSKRWIEVRDRACGMAPKTVEEKFTEGGAISAEGQRGYFGLGAKDCAVFGSLRLKTIDDKGMFTEVHIPGDFENCQWGHGTATKRDYEEVHGTPRRHTGTVVRITVDKLEQGGARMPRFESLVTGLRTHFALRSVNQRNKVTLRSDGRKPNLSESLVYSGFPWESETAKYLYEGLVPVEGYPESRPELKLYELAETLGRGAIK